MKIIASLSVIDPDEVRKGQELNIGLPDAEEQSIDIPRSVAYIPLINSHDHLVGNWVPRAGDQRPYANSHIWVEDMKNSFSFQERSKFWLNDGSFDLLDPAALTVARLGAYKNLFSGCGTVHDHAPLQKDEYYDAMPIIVPRLYRQGHSITMGNWWGGDTPEQEMEQSNGTMPFVIHLGEGTDEITKGEFARLKEHGMLKDNTLLIHGIAFTPPEIAEIAKVGASLCWCPSSNYYLLGKTLDIAAVLEHKANVVIGTDSTMSGGVNLIAEFATIREHYPQIPASELYRMVTQNAVKALRLHKRYGALDPENTQNLLLIDQIEKDPFENLMELEMKGIQLLLVDGLPRYGDSWLLDLFPDADAEYTIFRTGNREKFVIGDPLEINDQIDAALGYHKDFPFLPF
ncbi:MAG: amidohydrolase family protein [Candidatus Cloacimonetes bacterium]|nr:amidohydrolase family protein [Candidatus Cloacimonadota bacterium]MDD2422696.1 amidohydrolase family protein [Candidatus Cloacimonadota bacterium]